MNEVINLIEKKREKKEQQIKKLTNIQNELENVDIEAIVRKTCRISHEEGNVNYDIRDSADNEKMDKFFGSGVEALKIINNSYHDWNK